MFESIGWPELVVIAVVFVILFGGKKLPDLGRGIGEGIKNFKAGLQGEPKKDAGNEAGPEGTKSVEPAGQEAGKPVEKL